MSARDNDGLTQSSHRPQSAHAAQQAHKALRKPKRACILTCACRQYRQDAIQSHPQSGSGCRRAMTWQDFPSPKVGTHPVSTAVDGRLSHMPKHAEQCVHSTAVQRQASVEHSLVSAKGQARD